jgi:hypothetical protein
VTFYSLVWGIISVCKVFKKKHKLAPHATATHTIAGEEGVIFHSQKKWSFILKINQSFTTLGLVCKLGKFTFSHPKRGVQSGFPLPGGSFNATRGA